MISVLATAGDTHLGGEDFDNRVIEHFIHKYKKKTSTDVTKNQRALSKLKKEVEEAKRTLSSQMSTKLEIKSFENGNDFSKTLTRSKIEELNIDLFHKTMKPVEQVFKAAGITILSSSAVPPYPQDPTTHQRVLRKAALKDINPDEVVASAATIQAGILSGADNVGNVVFIDVCPLPLGIETTGGSSLSSSPATLSSPP
ncbi:unnamed protein product [Rhizoctonia solani]|uniref:Uncharacterized protein n=1 Tax=Rhizoctonia solani TaxID=456999 RepID=A0A8H3H5N9_9AGAM|nr:unnamed protein product [Rhizoctonia solani]